MNYFTNITASASIESSVKAGNDLTLLTQLSSPYFSSLSSPENTIPLLIEKDERMKQEKGGGRTKPNPYYSFMKSEEQEHRSDKEKRKGIKGTFKVENDSSNINRVQGYNGEVLQKEKSFATFKSIARMNNPYFSTPSHLAGKSEHKNTAFQKKSAIVNCKEANTYNESERKELRTKKVQFEDNTVHNFSITATENETVATEKDVFPTKNEVIFFPPEKKKKQKQVDGCSVNKPQSGEECFEINENVNNLSPMHNATNVKKQKNDKFKNKGICEKRDSSSLISVRDGSQDIGWKQLQQEKNFNHRKKTEQKPCNEKEKSGSDSSSSSTNVNTNDKYSPSTYIGLTDDNNQDKSSENPEPMKMMPVPNKKYNGDKNTSYPQMDQYNQENYAKVGQIEWAHQVIKSNISTLKAQISLLGDDILMQTQSMLLVEREKRNTIDLLLEQLKHQKTVIKEMGISDKEKLEQIKQLGLEVKRLERGLEDSYHLVEKFKADLSDQNSKLKDKEKEISDVQQTLKQKNSELKELEGLKQEIAKLEAELVSMKSQVEELLGESSKKNEEICGLYLQIEVLKSECANKNEAIKILENNVEKLKLEEKDSNTKIEELREELVSKDKTISELQTKVSDQDLQLCNYKKNVEEKGSRIAGFEDESYSNKCIISELRININTYEEKIKGLEESNTFLEKENTTLKSKLKEHQSSIIQITSANNLVESTLHITQDKCTGLESELAELKSRNIVNTGRENIKTPTKEFDRLSTASFALAASNDYEDPVAKRQDSQDTLNLPPLKIKKKKPILMTDISKKPTTVQSENNSRKLDDSTNSNPKADIKNKDSQDSQVSLFFTKPEEEPLLNNIDGEMKVWIDDLMDLYNSSHLDPTESTFSQKTSTPVTLEQEQPTSHSNTPNTYSK
ncbi:hypothetical protein AX774_g6659, partial [Zancudomyces culisetae]